MWKFDNLREDRGGLVFGERRRKKHVTTTRFDFAQTTDSQSNSAKDDSKKTSGKDKKKKNKKEKNTMSLDEFNKRDSASSSRHNSGESEMSEFSCLVCFHQVAKHYKVENHWTEETKQVLTVCTSERELVVFHTFRGGLSQRRWRTER